MINSRTINISKVAFLSLSMISFAVAILFVTDHTTVQVICMGIVMSFGISILNIIHYKEKNDLKNSFIDHISKISKEYMEIIKRKESKILSYKEEVKKIQEACLVIDDIERVNSLRKGDIIEITESKLVPTGIYSIVQNRMASVAMKGVLDDKDGITIIEDEVFEFPKIFLGAKETKIKKII